MASSASYVVPSSSPASQPHDDTLIVYFNKFGKFCLACGCQSCTVSKSECVFNDDNGTNRYIFEKADDMYCTSCSCAPCTLKTQERKIQRQRDELQKADEILRCDAVYHAKVVNIQGMNKDQLLEFALDLHFKFDVVRENVMNEHHIDIDDYYRSDDEEEFDFENI